MGLALTIGDRTNRLSRGGFSDIIRSMGEYKGVVGRKYERLAERLLGDRGFVVLDRNYRKKAGEIDIIAAKKGGLYFFEIRYRADGAMVEALDTIDRKKMHRIAKTAVLYVLENGMAGCDFISFGTITFNGKDVDVIEDAFRLDELGLRYNI